MRAVALLCLLLSSLATGCHSKGGEPVVDSTCTAGDSKRRLVWPASQDHVRTRWQVVAICEAGHTSAFVAGRPETYSVKLTQDKAFELAYRFGTLQELCGWIADLGAADEVFTGDAWLFGEGDKDLRPLSDAEIADARCLIERRRAQLRGPNAGP
jgi:hypothetical protein